MAFHTNTFDPGRARAHTHTEAIAKLFVLHENTTSQKIEIDK